MQQSRTAPSAPPRAVEPLRSPRTLLCLQMPDVAVCALCGDHLQGTGPHCRVRSPYDAAKLLVCSTCRKAARGDGYLPTA